MLAFRSDQVRIALLLLIFVWAAFGVRELSTSLKDAVDLDEAVATLRPEDTGHYWNGPGEPFGAYLERELPGDADVLLLGFSSQDAHVLNIHLYPRRVRWSESTVTEEVVTGEYVVFWQPTGQASPLAALLTPEQVAVEQKIFDLGPELAGVVVKTAARP